MSYPYISPEFRSCYQEYLENQSEMKTVFLVLSMSFLTVNPVSNKLFEYSSSSVEDAKRVAQKTDQPLLIYYTADWCLPCQIMNEYTFSDEYLTSEIHKNFVTVQVDKDDAESVEMIEE